MNHAQRRIEELSPERRALLERRLTARTRQGPRPMRCPATIPLSREQRGVWLECQINPQSPFYNVPATLRFDHAVDVDALRRALDELVDRHEALRTTFAASGGEPHQVVEPPRPFDLRILDCRRGPSDGGEELAIDSRRPFDLEKGPLARGLLVLRQTPGQDELGLTFHHAVVDGWSLAILLRELGTLYRAGRLGVVSGLPRPPLQCADYALLQLEASASDATERALAYWEEKLRAPRPVLRLPLDRKRPRVPGRRGGWRAVRLDRDIVSRVMSLARSEGATVFAVLLSAFEAFLHAETAQRDFLIGTPFANRTHLETEAVVGVLPQELRRLGGTPSEILDSSELMTLVLGAMRADYAASETYQLQPGAPLPCPITAIGGRSDPDVDVVELDAWKMHTAATFDSAQFDGDHFFPARESECRGEPHPLEIGERLGDVTPRAERSGAIRGALSIALGHERQPSVASAVIFPDLMMPETSRWSSMRPSWRPADQAE